MSLEKPSYIYEPKKSVNGIQDYSKILMFLNA